MDLYRQLLYLETTEIGITTLPGLLYGFWVFGTFLIEERNAVSQLTL